MIFLTNHFSTNLKMDTSQIFKLCKNGKFAEIKELCENGYDVNICDNEGYTTFHYACISGNIELVKYLSNYCDPLKRTKNQTTSAHFACMSGNHDVIDFVLKYDPKQINYQNINGDTPLHFAFNNPQNHKSYDFLIEKGGNPYINNYRYGRYTPVQYLLGDKFSDH